MKPTYLKCSSCGRFIGYKSDFTTYYEPDSHFGSKRLEWFCGRCNEKEQNK